MRIGAALLLSLVLLAAAGCSGKQAAAPGPAAASSASVHGIVVSAAIVPLDGVALRLEPGGRLLTTGPDGAFAFDGLEAGAYTIEAGKPGYRNVTIPVQAAAEGPVVKLVLDPDSRLGAYYDAYTFDGFVDSSFNVIVARGNNARSSPNYTIGERAPDLIQMELVWESTQSLGDNLNLTAIANDGGAAVPDFAWADGPSPLLLAIDSTVIQENKLGPKVFLDLAVFAGQEPVAADKGAGLTLNQPYRLITHMFYGYLPPDGWRFTSDGDPPSPS
jgi:hypothetical protein